MKKYYIFKMNLNLLSAISIIILVLVWIITYLFFPSITGNMLKIFFDMNLSYIVYMVLYFILHEILHAIGYIINGADYKNISFGMELEKGVFYCLCKQDVTKRNILISLMFPLFFIGIVTYAVAIIFNFSILLFLSILNIAGSAGDIMYFIFISKLEKNIMFSEMDDGTSFAILSDKDLSKEKSIGLEFVSVENDIPRNDFKIVNISKWSWVLLAICILIIIVNIVNFII